MSDLEQRLQNPGWHDCNHHLDMEEAADRLRQYREALEKIAGFDYETDDVEMQIVCADIARTALKETTDVD